MSEERAPIGERLDALIEEIIHDLSSLQVRRRSVEELDPEDHGILMGKLKNYRDGIKVAREEIDQKLSEILNRKLP